MFLVIYNYTANITVVRTSVVHYAHVWTMFEHQHCGCGVNIADRGHFVLAPFVLDRLHGLTTPIGRTHRVHSRLFVVPLGVRGFLKCLNQARPVWGFDHPKRTFAQVLREERNKKEKNVLFTMRQWRIDGEVLGVWPLPS